MPFNVDWSGNRDVVLNQIDTLWGYDHELKDAMQKNLGALTTSFLQYVDENPPPKSRLKEPPSKNFIAWAILGPNLILASTLFKLMQSKDKEMPKVLDYFAQKYKEIMLIPYAHPWLTQPILYLRLTQFVLRQFTKPPWRTQQPFFTIYYRIIEQDLNERDSSRGGNTDPASILRESISNEFLRLSTIWLIGIVASKAPWDPPECKYSVWGIVKMAKERYYHRFLKLLGERWRDSWFKGLYDFS